MFFAFEGAHRSDRYSQSSTFSPATLLNSPTLWVTKVPSWNRAVAAASRSLGPMTFDDPVPDFGDYQ